MRHRSEVAPPPPLFARTKNWRAREESNPRSSAWKGAAIRHLLRCRASQPREKTAVRLVSRLPASGKAGVGTTGCRDSHSLRRVPRRESPSRKVPSSRGMSPLASTSAARGPSVAMTEGVTQPTASPCAERGALPRRRGELREVGSGSLCRICRAAARRARGISPGLRSGVGRGAPAAARLRLERAGADPVSAHVARTCGRKEDGQCVDNSR